jgi:predicted tellurium resistance membrane protein TerC
MATGLILSIAMIAFAASILGRMLSRWPWLNYAGLALIAFMTVRMIVEGAESAAPLVPVLFHG